MLLKNFSSLLIFCFLINNYLVAKSNYHHRPKVKNHHYRGHKKAYKKKPTVNFYYHSTPPYYSYNYVSPVYRSFLHTYSQPIVTNTVYVKEPVIITKVIKEPVRKTITVNSSDYSNRQNLGEQIRELGYSLDWQSMTYIELCDIHNRIKIAQRLKDLGYEVDWQAMTYLQMAKIEDELTKQQI